MSTAPPPRPDPVEAVLPGGLAPSPAFGPGSRYQGLALATVEVGGRLVRYVTRRLVPQADRFAAVSTHDVGEGERPDTIAAACLGDPEQFWRLCDANNVMHPDELARVGRKVRVTLPEGVPAVGDE
ncbi:MAG: hypothetical protein QOK43_525 [Acidimicrobiaceae bacterium]|nr:hypothetical protein [Acidimicrobiaceae bacterium]